MKTMFKFNHKSLIGNAMRWTLLLVFLLGAVTVSAQSVRTERRLITSANELYRAQKFADAKVKYRQALEANPSSAVALFNLGLCDVRLAEVNKDNDSIRTKLIEEATQSLESVAKMGKEKPSLSAKANYNLGNLQFQAENYAGAIALYKQALRLDPNFADARKNLRIAQLKQQKNQNQGKDQNKDENKDQDKQDKQDQQDQSDRQDQQDRQEQQNPKENELSPQAAQQILNAVENNEQRARQGNPRGEKAHGGGGSMKKW